MVANFVIYSCNQLKELFFFVKLLKSMMGPPSHIVIQITKISINF